MTPTTHGLSVLMITGTGLLVSPVSQPVAVALLIGAVLGSNAPDWLELTWFDGRRRSLIPHRTWTHWWPWWVIAVGVGVAGVHAAHGLAEILLWSVGTGFGLGGLQHLCADVLNPTGIPLQSPAGRRWGLGWVRTGSAGEVGFLLALGGLCAAVRIMDLTMVL